MKFRRGRKRVQEIAPEEIFLDSYNLPRHEGSQFEGRVVSPLSRRTVLSVGAVFSLIALIFAGRAFVLQVVYGSTYATISEENTLDHSLLFATRGVVYDRNGKELAWNDVADTGTSAKASTSSAPTFALRRYTSEKGLAHILGFVQYPKADQKGTWWREDYTAMSGIELAFDTELHGENGSSMQETDAHGKIQRENIVAPPQNGRDLTLSVDADVQNALYTLLLQHANEQHFVGGAAIIMDVRTGQLLAMTSFPEYDNRAFTDGNSTVVRAMSKDPRTPLLNRAVSGLYAPGSIVKPIFAAAALNEGIIAPEKEILSTGALSIPNPYDPEHPSLFRDWAVHGLVDMRTAIAVSSDEYFYTIGGGYRTQPGLGIARLDEYAQKFGLGSVTGFALHGESSGVIPTPQWKEATFGANDPWRIGDTYHTAIGQYGFQITPIQAVRFIAAIGNGGKLLTPKLIASSTPAYTEVGIPDAYLAVVREGMRLAVTSHRTDATVKSLNLGGIHIAAKTGTAQIGVHNEWMNSWSVGFWPSEDPHYAYAVVLERAPAGTLSGAAPAMLPFFQWLISEKPEYVN
jgi:penicillin-binding protein 2